MTALQIFQPLCHLWHDLDLKAGIDDKQINYDLKTNLPIKSAAAQACNLISGILEDN